MCLPIFFGSEGNVFKSYSENTQLQLITILIGGILVAAAVAFSNYPGARQILANISFSIGSPILIFGIITLLYNKCVKKQPEGQGRQVISGPAPNATVTTRNDSQGRVVTIRDFSKDERSNSYVTSFPTRTDTTTTGVHMIKGKEKSIQSPATGTYSPSTTAVEVYISFEKKMKSIVSKYDELPEQNLEKNAFELKSEELGTHLAVKGKDNSNLEYVAIKIGKELWVFTRISESNHAAIFYIDGKNPTNPFNHKEALENVKKKISEAVK